MKYSIPEINIETLEKKLARIARKADKYGCPFVYNRVGDHFEEKEYRDAETGKNFKEIVHYIDVEVEGTAKIDGWEFVATLDYTPAGNIIKGTGKVEVPEKYYSCTPWCEHCKTARDRKSSYIVWNEDTGDFAQVGRNCLRDFTGGLSAEAVASYEQWIKEAEEMSVFTGYGLGWHQSYFNCIDFMAITAEVIRIYGYVKRNTPGTECTADHAENIYRITHGMRLGALADYIRDQYDEAVSKGFNPDRPEALELAQHVRDWVNGSDQNSNYIHNLKVACANDEVDGGKLGLLVSAFPAYDREMDYRAEKLRRELRDREAGALSRYIGNVGDRITVTIAECKALTSWETDWGITTIYRFVDTDGNHIIWKTSKWIDDEQVIGKTIKGTVKDHRDFREVHQTELTRCKIA